MTTEPFIPHADSIQTAWVLMCQQSRVSTQPPVEELEAEFDRFITRVRRDAARDLVDALCREGVTGKQHTFLSDYMSAHYPETGDWPMNTLTTEDRDRLRELASGATPGPWEAFGTTVAAITGTGGCDGCSGLLSPAHEPSCYWSEIAGACEADAEFIAAADPATVTALLDALDEAEAERGEARADLAAIRARDDEVCTDEGWWIGGAWGDYGEVVLPLRALSYVVGGELDQKVTDIDPGFALTYAEQVARADRAEAAIERVREQAQGWIDEYYEPVYRDNGWAQGVVSAATEVIRTLDGEEDDDDD